MEKREKVVGEVEREGGGIKYGSGLGLHTRIAKRQAPSGAPTVTRFGSTYRSILRATMLAPAWIIGAYVLVSVYGMRTEYPYISCVQSVAPAWILTYAQLRKYRDKSQRVHRSRWKSEREHVRAIILKPRRERSARGKIRRTPRQRYLKRRSQRKRS